MDANREPMTELIPSKSGVHIVTRPFNYRTFKMLHPNIDVHKDNMVIQMRWRM